MTQDELQRLALHYGDMSETELMKVARQYDDLHEDAQSLLREEFRRRSLEPPLIDDPAPSASYDSRNLVTVARYRDLSEAIVARSVLEAEDIPCLLKDENTVRMDWTLSNFLGGLRLQVPEDDVPRAQELLGQPLPQSIEFADESSFDQPACPKCGSTNVELHGAPSAAKVIGLFVFNVPIPSRSPHPGEEVWHCLACGCNWIDDQEPSVR